MTKQKPADDNEAVGSLIHQWNNSRAEFDAVMKKLKAETRPNERISLLLEAERLGLLCVGIEMKIKRLGGELPKRKEAENKGLSLELKIAKALIKERNKKIREGSATRDEREAFQPQVKKWVSEVHDLRQKQGKYHNPNLSRMRPKRPH